MIPLHRFTLQFDAFAKDHPEDKDLSIEKNRNEFKTILKKEITHQKEEMI